MVFTHYDLMPKECPDYDGSNALLNSVQTQVMFSNGVLIVMLIKV